ncbi:MAG: DUF6702 family protein [Ferruginibacter sp.]
MVSFLFKWLIIGGLVFNPAATVYHPIYVSVTEIEHNAKDKTLEISCKIFTDDFEQTLRQAYKTHIDLLAPKEKTAMSKLVNDYVQKHLQVKVEGKTATLQFLGYQQEEEGIVSFFQANNIPVAKKIELTNDILFEYKKEQMSIIHVIVDGNRKSSKLINPENKVSFDF